MPRIPVPHLERLALTVQRLLDQGSLQLQVLLLLQRKNQGASKQARGGSTTSAPHKPRRNDRCEERREGATFALSTSFEDNLDVEQRHRLTMVSDGFMGLGLEETHVYCALYPSSARLPSLDLTR